MAIGRGEETRQEDLGHISDESDFYGDEATKAELENRANSFSPTDWWTNKTLSLGEMASTNIAANAKIEAAVLFNLYDGKSYGRQLSETVNEFLERLPPATTQIHGVFPFICVANPYVQHQGCSSTGAETLIYEGPPDYDGARGDFVTQGRKFLEKLSNLRAQIEKDRSGQSHTIIKSELNIQKNRIVQEILDAAVETRCTSGKWMLFCSPHEVNAVWAVVAHKTVNNDLGFAAKVSGYNPNGSDSRGARLICIYTRDFTDMGDVSRVLRKLRELGLVQKRGKQIFYKPDAYTYLDLDRGNKWEIKASLYASGDILNAKQGSQIEGFFYKKKERAMEE